MATVWIDGQKHDVDASKNLLEVCLGLGYDLPYFCWHPALGSVGACRQCAVAKYDDEDDDHPEIVMSCMTPAKDGTRISLRDDRSVAFRKNVTEWLMINHPHDCPICDEGGECHLQDVTVMTGHTYRDYRFDKRTYRNQDLGPFINHEMNRCIQCYRCVRFYQDHAGGRDLDAFSIGDRVYFGRKEDGTLQSPFSGNLVEICPTGVFTDKTLKKHYTRKWDLQTAPSICPHCAVGCNLSPGERYGTLRRIRNRYNHDVNGYFLCDRGRFGYEYVNSEDRILRPTIGDSGRPATVSVDGAIDVASRLLRNADRVVGIGSPRASLESNFALRQLVGGDQFFAGTTDADHALAQTNIEILRDVPVPSASVREAERADAVLVLGEDVLNTAPRLALALRQAAREAPFERAAEAGVPRWNDAAIRRAAGDEHGPFFIATPDVTDLDGLAEATLRLSPPDIARFGFAVAHQLDPSAPRVPDLDPDLEQLAGCVADALSRARRPLVVSGWGCDDVDVLRAAANVAAATPGCRIHLTPPETNSLGLAMLRPRPFSELPPVDDDEELAVILLETELERRVGEDTFNAFLDGAESVIAIDYLESATTRAADVVLPAGPFPESDGTVVNSEGRAQRFFAVYEPELPAIPDAWRWLDRIACELDATRPGWSSLDDVVRTITASARQRQISPLLELVDRAAEPASFRLAGQNIPRAPSVYTGRTAMSAHRDVHEPRPPHDRDSPLAFSMEGTRRQPPPSVMPRVWAPRWNSVQALNKFQDEVGGALRGGPSGVRLFDGKPEHVWSYYADPPARFRYHGRYYVVASHHVFGDDYTSSHGDAVTRRAPEPYVKLHPDDAAAIGVTVGDMARLSANGHTVDRRVKLGPTLPRGVAVTPQSDELPPSTWTAIRPAGGGRQ
jgi:NADH-quinone oxidoreductase subunit G